MSAATFNFHCGGHSTAQQGCFTKTMEWVTTHIGFSSHEENKPPKTSSHDTKAIAPRRAMASTNERERTIANETSAAQTKLTRSCSKTDQEYTFPDDNGSTQDRPTNLNYVNPHHTQSNLNEFPGEGPDRAGKDPIRGHDHCHNGTTSTREDRTRPRRELRWTPELPTTQRTDQIRDQEGHSGCHEGCQ